MARLEELEIEWSKDCKIDRTALDTESLRIPELHNKYYKMYIREKMTLKAKDLEYKQFYKTKHEYYNGRLSQEELKEYGLEPFPLLLKSDINVYLDADKELAPKLIELNLQKEKVEFLESIIKTLNNRGFNIKSAIDFIRFSNGG